MQDRYVGDVGDFAKYALLRRISGGAGERRLQIGVVWCLLPNERHNADGRHVSYLDNSEFFGLDDELLAVLRRIISTRDRRVRAVIDSGILPRDSVFCEDPVPPIEARESGGRRLARRSAWLEQCYERTARCDLVFFDPDNGVETASVGKTHQKAGKYIFWDELRLFWARGQTLFIYHHLNRTKSAARQVAELTDRLNSEFHRSVVTPLVFSRGSRRVFLLVCPSRTKAIELKCRMAEFGEGGWARHFEIARARDR